MQRKGISIWEQHLERLVLGGAVIFFVVFTAMQFLREPNSVEVSSQGTVKPGEVDDLLRDKAVALRGRLAPEASPELDIPNRPRVSDQFASALASSVSPEEGITPSHRRVVIVGEFDVRLDVAYVEPVVPAPTQVVVEQYFDALADEVVSAHADLQERFPEVPYDLTWMTAAAVFDLRAVREEYGKTGANGESPIPVNWFYNNVHVLDVEVEREERVGGAWTHRVKLDPLPGQITLRDRLDGEVDSAVRNELIAYLGEAAEQAAILRPDFYGTRNEAWTPPDPRFGGAVTGLSEDELQALRLRKKVARATAERDRLYDRLVGLGGSMDREETGETTRKPPPTPPPGDESPPGSSGSGAGSGGGTGSAGGGGGDRRQGKKRAPPGAGAGSGFGMTGGEQAGAGRDRTEAIERLRKQVWSKNKAIRRYQADLVEFETEHGVGTDEAEVDPDSVTIWAHDMTVEPGKKYRYRFTVQVYNPFFTHRRNLLEEQHELAEKITLASQTSEWSAEKEAIPPLKVFITKAMKSGRTAGDLSMGQCTAEVYRFFYGRWWMHSFSLQPGDRVGEARPMTTARDDDAPAIDFGTDWFVLDVLRDIDADRTEEDRGLGAYVWLQSLSDAGVTMLGDPRQAERDPDRQQLREAVEAAEMPEEFASAGGDGSGG